MAGGGIFGVSAALHLARAGHEVVLLEREQIAGATTGMAAGLLSFGVEDASERRLVGATIRGVEETARALEEPSPLDRPGSYILARSAVETAHLEELSGDLKRLGEPHGSLSPQEWRQEMKERGLPAQTKGLEAVLSVPGDAWALSTETTNLLARAAIAAGVQVRSPVAVATLLRRGDEVTGVRLAGGEEVEADAVVLAMGAWTRPFLEREGYALPALSFTTHAAVLSLDSPVRAPIVHDHPGHYYFRPESGTHLLVGNGTDTTTTDPDSFHPTADPDFFRSVADRITKRFPPLAHARLKTAWRGILTATPDRAALAGKHPQAHGLWVFTGDNGYGFMRGYALGSVLAKSIDDHVALADGVPAQAMARADPARFWPDPPAAFPVREGFELTGAPSLP